VKTHVQNAETFCQVIFAPEFFMKPSKLVLVPTLRRWYIEFAAPTARDAGASENRRSHAERGNE
jgi:hypothetical protein